MTAQQGAVGMSTFDFNRIGIFSIIQRRPVAVDAGSSQASIIGQHLAA
jgi:hypothetical protein